MSWTRLFASLLTLIGCLAGSGAMAAGAGEVLYSEGVGTVQETGQPTKILGKGVVVNQGDVITTAPHSYAIVKMADGTSMTLRPSTQLVIQRYEFKPQAREGDSAGSMLFDLVRGGLRTVTGLIPKRNLDAARIHTPSATVGIRGTEMDVRLCHDGSCNTDTRSATSTHPPRPNIPLASARIARIQGQVNVKTADGTVHLIGLGGSLYPGDTVVTNSDSYAVLGFRDESKVTVQASTQMRIDDFVFDEKNPAEGRFLINLIKGGLRAFTGIVGRANQEHVSIHTASATVGIRGTGGDIFEDDTGFSAATWDGQLHVKENATGAELEMPLGVVVSIDAREHLHRIPSYTHAFGPRPDSVNIDWKRMWAREAIDDHDNGLWVLVFKGPVHPVPGRGGEAGSLDVGDREAFYCDELGGRCAFPTFIPSFFDDDETPDPTQPLQLDLIEEIKPSGVNAVCRH
jgi:hypothetical protein